jgi:predicted nucleic acid-binding protein
MNDLSDLRIDRVPHAPLLERAWELRQNLTIYDGVYIALAERLDVTLVTADVRLAQAPGARCGIEVLGQPA